jgi:AraC-like DNA-binding protein
MHDARPASHDFNVRDYVAAPRPIWLNGDWSAASSPSEADLLPMNAPGTVARAGSFHRDGMHVDLQWHYHDMHKLLYAFEGAIEVESTRGRNLIPRQLAAWIPAGVPHCTSIHGIRWVSVYFTTSMLEHHESRVRTVFASPLMREMLREAMRWPVTTPDSPLRTMFYATMAKFCEEWIEHEVALFVPVCRHTRVKRVLDYTVQHLDLGLDEICRHVGISQRSLRRNLKAQTGMTWEEYRHRNLLLQAISLLGETDEPVSQIAARCGFASPSAFAKVFREQLGEVPSDYRRRARDANSV